MPTETAVPSFAAESPLHGQLLDREAELEALHRLIDDAERGAGRIALIVAAPGLGKTRLLEEARRNARVRGVTVLSARGTELERSFAFGVVHQLFDPVLRASADQDLDELMGGAAALALPVLSAQPGSSESLDDPSYGVLHGLYWLVANLAQRSPVLIALDDAQWADRPSGRFLEFLAPRLEGMCAAVMVAARDRHGAPQIDALSAIAQQPVERIHPRPLTESAVAELLESRVDRRPTKELPVACIEATGGNPFLLHELLDELVRKGAAGEDLDPATVRRLGPRSVSAGVLARVGRTAGAAALARAIAVLGDGSGIAEVAALAEIDVGETARIADALAEAAILERGRPLSFAHPIVRAAVYEEISPAMRTEMHARAAELALRRGSAPDVIASHLLKTEPRGDPAVVESLRRAAETALGRGAPEPAIDYLRRALEEPPAVWVRPNLLHALGSALAWVGDREAVDLLGEAFELAEDPEQRARIALDLAQLFLIAGQLTPAIEVLESVLEQLPDASAAFAGLVEAQLLALGTTAVSGRRRLRRRVAEAAARLDDLPAERGRLLLHVVAFERSLGAAADADAAAALARRALADERLGEERSDAAIAYGAPSTLWVVGRYEEGERAVTALLEAAQRRGSARGYAMASAMRSWQRYLRGELRGAEADARACLELASEASWGFFNPLATAVLGAVLLERGDPEGAERAVAPYGVFRDDDDLGFVQILHITEARIHLGRGSPEDALETLARCRRFEEGWGANPGIACTIPWRSLSALAEARRGNRPEALALGAEEVGLARDFGVPRPLGIALRVLGNLEGGASGIELLEEAVGVLETADAQVEHARALVDLGAALRRMRRRADAREPLAKGMDLAHRCGATALATRAREELVAAGARPRRLATSGPDALTASERRVAGLASEGMTNRGIAQALFVTQRTVEGHLSNAFAKLGIESREELERALAVEAR